MRGLNEGAGVVAGCIDFLEPCQDQKGYVMKLANGRSWGLTATPSAGSWLEKMADMLGLESGRSECESNVIFTTKDDRKIPEILALFSSDITSGNGWKNLKLPPVSIHYKEDQSHVVFELGGQEFELIESIWVMLFAHYIYRWAEEQCGLPLHAALLEHDDRGFAIIAPGGTGKSTCSRRVHAPWRSLCDDEALVIHDEAGLYYAHPFPTWSMLLGKEAEGFEKLWHVPMGVPLKGIFILEQSPSDEILPISQAEAALYIYDSACQTCPRIWSYYSPEELRASKRILFENACLMSKSIPAFILRASLTGRFWEHMEQAIRDTA
jgi:SynChlorMet cassette protein ScmC